MNKSALTCDRCLQQSVTFGYYWYICVLDTLPKASQQWFPQHQFFPANRKDLQVLPFMLLLSIKFTGIFALVSLDVAQPKNTLRKARHSQLLPCWHPFITNTPIQECPIIWTGVKSYEKIYKRCLTEINSCNYGLSLMRTSIQGPHSVLFKGRWTQYSVSRKGVLFSLYT